MTETTAIVCDHVFNSDREVKAVIHHNDGVWQLVCGYNDHLEDCSNFRVVGLEHIIERQENILQIVDLPRGWLAEWTGKEWIRQHEIS